MPRTTSIDVLLDEFDQERVLAVPMTGTTVRPTGPGKCCAVYMSVPRHEAYTHRKSPKSFADPAISVYLSPQDARRVAHQLLANADLVEQARDLHKIEVPW